MRKTFEMTKEDVQKIERITRSLKPGQEPSAEMMDRLNKVWAEIGKANGFDWETVEEVEGKPYTTFSAEELVWPDAPPADPDPDKPEAEPETKGQKDETIPPEGEKIQPSDEKPEVIPFDGTAEKPPYTPETKAEAADGEKGEQKPLFGPEDNVRNVLRQELGDLVTDLENLDKRIEKAEAEKKSIEERIQEVQVAIRAFEKIAAGQKKKEPKK